MVTTILTALTPDILIVSGDLAHQPVFGQMKKAARLVREFKTEGNVKRLIVIPGNHDYKFSGNFGIGRFTRIPFELYFRRGALELPWRQRFSLGLRLALNCLRWNGSEMRSRRRCTR